MKQFNISDLKKLNTNKQIMWLDKNMKLTIKTIIDSWLRQYRGIPLTWEDLYYEFLYDAPNYIENFDDTLGLEFKTYIGVRCRYFSSNKCRKYSNSKYKVMNTYSPLDKVEHKFIKNYEPELEIDTSCLEQRELNVYEAYFVKGLNFKEICEKNNISRYKLNKIIDSIKAKLLIQVKN